VDTLFFRDGSASAADSSNQLAVGGVFPPYPPTVVGAVRAALARANGWSGRGPWPDEVKEVLGDGYGEDSLGALTFDGPYLLRDGAPHFPVPAHLVGTGNPDSWRPRARLGPGTAVMCDLGDQVRLPALLEQVTEGERLAPAEGRWWLSAAALLPVLRGELPDGPVIASTGLWVEESRVGIERSRHTRTVREGMLFSTRHVRPDPSVSIGVRVTGVPPAWHKPYGELVPLGGEGRAVQLQEWAYDKTPSLPADEITTRFTVVALTPLDVSEEFCQGRGTVPDLGGATVVSACLPPPLRIGGWRTLPPARPLPLRSVLPPGSVLFCEVKDRATLWTVIESADGQVRIGRHQSWGFGAVALGRWPDDATAHPVSMPATER
jgi:CRISPR-associated protein Cmr3